MALKCNYCWIKLFIKENWYSQIYSIKCILSSNHSKNNYKIIHSKDSLVLFVRLQIHLKDPLWL